MHYSVTPDIFSITEQPGKRLVALFKAVYHKKLHVYKV